MDLFDLFVKIGVKDEASDQIGGIGDKLKGGLATAGKVAAAGITAATAAVGALSKASLDSYASYEQLVGGVETLFGAGGQSVEEYAASVGKSVSEAQGEYDKLMAAQQAVLNDADAAYQTAGMSANDYMETVTGFSASLLQSLGGDTQAAAEYANRAVIDMSDNANKMGTDMTLIQNAYQGFAKQNYTMLDNLKLGYGGTQEEMKRLIADAAQMTDVQEKLGVTVDASSMSFGNVVNAISVMQESMGIAGTTAKEASTTIEGSLNAAKASWSNLLTAMASDDGNVGEYVEKFVDSVETAANNIIPRLETIFTGIGELITRIVPIVAEEIPVLIESVLPGLLSAGTQLLVGIVQGIAAGLPILAAQLPFIITTIYNGVVQAAPQLYSAAGEVINALVTGIAQLLPMLLDSGMQLIATLANGFVTGLPTFIAALPGMIDGILSFISANLPTILQQGVEIVVNLSYGIIQAIPRFIAVLPQIILSFTSFIAENLPTIIETGIELIASLALGILNAIPSFLESVAELISELVDAFLNYDWLSFGAQVVQSIIDSIGAAWNNLVEWFGGLWDGLFGNRSVDVNVNANATGAAIDGSNKNGLDYVPFDGYISELHKGEMVVPAKQAAALRSGSFGNVYLTVNAAPGQDEEAIANKVMQKIERQKQRRVAALA